MRMKSAVKIRFPKAWQRARTLKLLIELVPRVFGYRHRHCNICGFEGKFLAEIHFPDIFTFDAVCPQCGSLPRNRLAWMAISEQALLNSDGTMLHFAPEPALTGRFRALVGDYKTADINPVGVDLKLDIEAIDLPADSFDTVYCSHVLEHVNHRKALTEIHRVLKPGGLFLCLIPLVEGWEEDYENDAIVMPDDRGIHFGKDNHLRRFGRNVRDEFAKAGFALENFTADGRRTVEFGLIPGETLMIGRCVK